MKKFHASIAVFAVLLIACAITFAVETFNADNLRFEGTHSLHNKNTATNTVTDRLLLKQETTGTPAAGFGVGIDIQAEFADGLETACKLEVVWTDVATGTEDADLVVKCKKAGTTTEAFRITSKGGYLNPPVVHTATGTLTVADCNRKHYLSHATTAIILTLPAPTAGCDLTFITALAFSDQHEIRTPSATNIIEGTLHVNAADVACVNEDSIEFADTAETVGDNATITSDGTSWHIIDSIADTAAAIACTT